MMNIKPAMSAQDIDNIEVSSSDYVEQSVVEDSNSAIEPSQLEGVVEDSSPKVDDKLEKVLKQNADLISILKDSAKKQDDVIEFKEPVFDTPRPKRAEYDDPDEFEEDFSLWLEAKADFNAEQKFNRRVIEEQNKGRHIQARQQFEKQRSTFFDEGTKQYKDFIDVVSSDDVPLTVEMAVDMFNSEKGIDVAYYLGKNLNEAKRIASLSVPQQLKELGKLETKLGNEVKVQAKNQVSKAPAPIKTINTRGTTIRSSIDSESDEDYFQTRMAEKFGETGAKTFLRQSRL